jgi:AAA15 family ATPase/GTPase
MLIEFKFKNYFSYKDEVTLNMTSVKSFKELKSTNTFKSRKAFDLLKTAAIYGTNGGGKTNLIEAIGYMCYVVHNSFAESLKKDEDKKAPNDTSFRLSTLTEGEPSFFEVSFVQNEHVYRYGFEISRYEIVSEWLFKKKEVETLLFQRTIGKFKINSTGFSEGNKYKNAVPSNVLFLSYLAQNNAKESTSILNWFKDLNVISGLEDAYHKNATKFLLENPDSGFKAWLGLAVRFLEISNIGIAEKKDIITYHNKFDENNVVVESVEFALDVNESAGTQKLVYLLGAIYDTLTNGKILFIDELDAKLHPNLSIKILSLFHKLNVNGAQFIFTAHDAIMLDRKILRRDQIWFVDRNKFGVSELYPMSDFDAGVVRNTSDFKKKYLESVFGAAESMNINSDLIELLNGKQN